MCLSGFYLASPDFRSPFERDSAKRMNGCLFVRINSLLTYAYYDYLNFVRIYFFVNTFN